MRLKITTLVLAIMVLSSSLMGQRNENKVREQSLKYNYFLAYLNRYYVDTVNIRKVTEDAIIKVLGELDPHSVYIPKEEVEEMNAPLRGGFFGVGIQFNIVKDTLRVVQVLAGGPAEKVGLNAGDRIVEVDGEKITNVKLTNSQVQKYLKGEKGTIVKLKVLRKSDYMDFRIVRDKIPIHSVEAAYMIDDKIGYINISRFSANTLEEFEDAVRKLRKQGMQDLILDLVRNGGGFLGAATGVADHFLDANKLIVYTEGVDGRRNTYSSSAGYFKEGRLVVLIDQNSASSSEIVSGAVQDWDRGIIVGRRSFGKGLVQGQFPFQDSSMMRLTTAYYYTPSGRCIQKPYKGGLLNYEMEVYDRYKTGELVDADKMKVNDSLKYYTKINRRVVYGGGGIIPDIFVPLDTTVNYIYSNNLVASGVVREFVSDYLDKNRNDIKRKYKTGDEYLKGFKVTDKMIDEIVKEGKKKGIEPVALYRISKQKAKKLSKKEIDRITDIKKNKPTTAEEKAAYNEFIKPVISILKTNIKANIAIDMWDTTTMFKVYNEDSDILTKAIKALKDGEYERILRKK